VKLIVNGSVRNGLDDAASAFRDLPKARRRDIIADALRWMGIQTRPMASLEVISDLIDAIMAGDGGEEFAWLALDRMAQAAEKSGEDEGVNGLFARP